MADEQPLGQLLKEFIDTLGRYLRQSAAAAVDEALAAPLRRAARKVALLGVAFGAAVMGAVFLALAFFHLLAETLASDSAAYAASCGVCVAVAILCSWVVSRDGKARRGEPSGSTRRSGEAVDGSPPETD